MVEHKFFKFGDDWNIRCPITGGSFSTEAWKTEKIPKNYCPCCQCNIGMELLAQRTRKEIKKGNQETL